MHANMCVCACVCVQSLQGSQGDASHYTAPYGESSELLIEVVGMKAWKEDRCKRWHMQGVNVLSMKIKFSKLLINEN